MGKRLAIVTNGGGPGVMAADRAGDMDIPLAELSADTMKALEQQCFVDQLVAQQPDRHRRRRVAGTLSR